VDLLKKHVFVFAKTSPLSKSYVVLAQITYFDAKHYSPIRQTLLDCLTCGNLV